MDNTMRGIELRGCEECEGQLVVSRGVVVDVEYALGQLRRQAGALTSVASIDCRQRAEDALGRVLEALTRVGE